MSNKLRGIVCPLLAAFIWGSAFVAQSIGANTVEPFTFTACRSWVGAIALLLLSLAFRRKTAIPAAEKSRYWHDLLWGGVGCGMALMIATNLQQAGLSDTSAGKAGFLTSLYVVLVPIFGLFCHRHASLPVWISTGIALVGLYLLCITDDFSIQASDLLILLCAVFFAVQILLIDRLPHIHGMHLCCVQLFVSAIGSTVLALLFEQPRWDLICESYLPILYCGVFSSAIAYTLQIVSQKGTNPTVICLLLCLESVFSVLCGWVILHDELTLREIAGCVLMFSSVVLANIFPVQSKRTI